MGCCKDWSAHWRWMGLEMRTLCHAIAKTPGHAFKTAFLHPVHFAFWWFVVALYLNAVASVETERLGYRNSDGSSETKPKRDQGFVFPFIDYTRLSDILLYATLAVTCIRFLPLWPCCKPAMFRTIARRWLFLEGVIFWFRAASVVMTSDPFPDETCVSTANGNVWIEAWRITFGVSSTCGDCMFSGHTAAITLLMLFWSHYSRGEEFAICFGTCQGICTPNVDAAGDPMGWKFLDILLYAWALMCFYFIIATRFHYSHDVFVGCVITFLLFQAYHFYIKSLAMRQGSLFSRFMRWFEGVSLSPASLAKVTTDAQTGHAILASTSATEEAIRAGAEVTKNNAMIGSHQLAVAALPVSYLEGNNYYRVGGDNSKLTHLHPEAALHGHADGRAYDAAAAHQQWPSKMEDGDAPVGARFSHPAPGTQFEHDTAVRIHTTAPGQAPPGVRMPAELAHNEQLPVPILVTGEAAAQEDREVRQVEMV